jgi:hypothetical protein
VSGAAFGLRNEVLKSVDQATFLTRVSGPQDEKSCTLTAREPSMYVRPTTEPLLRLVAAEKCTPHLASQPSREYYIPNLNKDNPMNRIAVVLHSRRNRFVFFAALACAISPAMAAPLQAQFSLVKISSDSFHNSDSQHKTEVEPDTYSWGSTMVAAFQVARISGGGGADLGFSTSTDGGKTWTFGYLPGLTVNYKNGSYQAASDASVVYDAKHGVWLISSLPIGNSGVNIAVSRSKDGIHWGNPIPVDSSGGDDKNWITCDNTATSPFYGNCYTEWSGVLMSTSTDGGLTWGSPKGANGAFGTGAEQLVLPNGTVVVPFLGNGMQAFTSTNGGASWGHTVTISQVNTFQGNSSLRSVGLPFPSTGIDKSGKLYVVWSDCSFRTGCSTNDLVMSTSSNGTKWTTPARIPIDKLNSTVDHFIPGLAVDRATSGKTAHLTTTYYYYPAAGCSDSTCQINVGFTTSQDGGKTWIAGKQLAGPMKISWLPNTFSGPMLADYLSSSYVDGKAFGVFMVAKAPSGGLFSQAAYTTKQALEASADEPRFSSRGEKRIPNAHADRPFPRSQGEERATPPSGEGVQK